MPETRIPKLQEGENLEQREEVCRKDIDKMTQERNLADDMWRDRQEWRAGVGRHVML